MRAPFAALALALATPVAATETDDVAIAAAAKPWSEIRLAAAMSANPGQLDVTTLCRVSSCTMVSTMVFSGASPDITAATGEALTLVGGGASGASGKLVLQSRQDLIDFIPTQGTPGATDTITLRLNYNGDQSVGGGLETTGNRFILGDVAQNGALIGGSFTTGDNTKDTFWIGAGFSNPNGSGWLRYFNVTTSGAIYLDKDIEQSGACAANVISITPTSSIFNLDANNANCVITMNTTNVRGNQQLYLTVTATAGAGVVTFAGTNFLGTLPVSCSTTGFNLGHTVHLYYSDAAAKWTIVGGCL